MSQCHTASADPGNQGPPSLGWNVPSNRQEVPFTTSHGPRLLPPMSLSRGSQNVTVLRERGTEISVPEHLQGASSVPLYGRGCQRAETAVNCPKHFRFTKFQQSKLILRCKCSLCRAMRSHLAPPQTRPSCVIQGATTARE